MEDQVAATPSATEAVPTPNMAGPAPAQPAQPAQPAPAQPAQPAAPVANIPADKIEAFNRFIDGNGGFDSAFAKLKHDISAPASQQMPQTIRQGEPQMQPQAQQMQPQPQYQQPERLPNGYISQEELNIKRVYDDFARDPGYAPIKDELSSGEIFKTMSRFGIKPVGPNGSVNVGQVKDFLDMYAKSKAPAIAPSAPVSTTPTVDYVNVGQQITSRDDALAVMRQNMSLNGVAPHPQTEAAKEYLKNYFKK